MRIYTLTLNPAYDVHVHADHFEPFHENIATVLSREAGGKGVNISRALHSAHIANTAVIVVGSDNAAEYRKKLAQSGLSVLEIERPGSIRENLTLHCDNGPETRISFTGFAAGDSILDEIFEQILPDEDTILTMTGRIANGMTMERVKAFLKKATAQGAKIVVDSRSFSLSDLAEVKPWLIKPNQEEISAYCGEPVEDIETALAEVRMVFGQFMVGSEHAKTDDLKPYDHNFNVPMDYAYPLPYHPGTARRITFVQKGVFADVPVEFVKSIMVRREELYE